MTWGWIKPASGIPAGGSGLHGAARGGPGKAFSVDHQPPAGNRPDGKVARAEFRRVLAEKLAKVAEVYDAALIDPDPRVGLVAAKQISVELWGQPTQEHSGPDGGPIPTSLTIAFIKPNAEPAD